jgi:hypothetical protein
MSRERGQLQIQAWRAVSEALALSPAQRQLWQQARALSPTSVQQALQRKGQLERLAACQQGVVEDAGGVGTSLRSLADKTPLAGPELPSRLEALAAQMEEAARALQGGEAAAAALGQQQALADLNRLVAELVALGQSLGEQPAARAGGEYLPRVQPLAQQQAIDEQSQRAGDASPRLAELGTQQAWLKTSPRGLAPGPGPELADRLGGVGERMDGAANDLPAHRLREQTQIRQRAILHKMLEAQRSLYTRWPEGARVAQRPEPFAPTPSPPAITLRGGAALAVAEVRAAAYATAAGSLPRFAHGLPAPLAKPLMRLARFATWVGLFRPFRPGQRCRFAACPRGPGAAALLGACPCRAEASAGGASTAA